MKQPTRVVCLGGGWVAIYLARKLRRAAKKGEVNLTVISRDNYSTVHGLIAEVPRTAYDIAQAMWGNIAVTQAYLTLSEVLGHTDLLLNAGRIAEDADDGGVVRFRALG